MQLHPIIKEDVNTIIKTTQKNLAQLAGRHILITGASGFLARYLVYTFLEANQSILQKKPVTLYLTMRKKIKPFAANANLHYLYLDIAKTVPAVPQVDYVIHAASPSAPKHYMRDMINTFNVNILGTYNLINACDNNLKSFLFISSGEVYSNIPKLVGDLSGGGPSKRAAKRAFVGTSEGQDPQYQLNPRSCYVEGKRAAEAILMNYFWEKKLPVKIARLFHTYGPGIDLSDGRAMSDFIADGLAGRPITIKGNKDITRPFLYIADATIMLIKLLTSTKNGEIYDIANPEETVSIQDLAQNVAKIINKKLNKNVVIGIQKTARSFYDGAPGGYTPSISAYIRHYKHKPSISLIEGISRTLQILT